MYGIFTPLLRIKSAAIVLAVLASFSANALAISTHTLDRAEWSLISIPANPGSAGTVESLFGDDLPVASYGQGGSWTIIAYDAASNAYRELSLSDTLSPNTGYWAIQTEVASAELDLPDSLSALSGTQSPGCPQGKLCANQALEGGQAGGQWNLVGASVDTSLGFGDTRFQSNSACGSACTPDQAVAANAINSPAYAFNNSAYEKLASSSALQPWDGVWISVLNNASQLKWLLPVGDAPSNPDPETDSPMTAAEKDATRLLMQGSFGPTDAEIDNVLALGGPAQWVDKQMKLPVQRHLPIVNQLYPYNVDRDRQKGRYIAFWRQAIGANDQLRQRVAFALSQILVISDKSNTLTKFGSRTAAYYDILLNNAFGNYRQLLQEATLNPAMGGYLSMMGNGKPDASKGLRADENYAREIMQLFSIGLEGLNLDGTTRQGTVTYTQPDVENLARILTGWSWNVNNWRENAKDGWRSDRRTLEKPMKAFAGQHDTDEKSFLGTTFPAGQSAEKDLTMALDILFNHPNVGPFVSKQLIKRLVTSNPSNAYVQRVSTIFINNGAGVRGDLAAVVKAILLDDEARNQATAKRTDFGKLREPLLRYAHTFRAFGLTDPVKLSFWQTKEIPQIAPLTAPSVFNYYSPDYKPPGILTEANLTAPEFQINSASSLSTVNSTLMRAVLRDEILNFPTRLNVQKELQLLNNGPTALLNHLDRVLTAGRLSSASRQILTEYINANKGRIENARLVRDVIGLIVTSTEFAIQR